MGIALAARAKLNLYLAVRRRRDDGYHDIETVFHSLALADDVRIAGAPALDVSCEPDLGVAAVDNLAYRAALELAEDAGVDPCARIRIAKRIPTAAGLGGGSADAAATLVGTARLWGIGWPPSRLRTVASAIGADVPFMVEGGAAIGRGRGDDLEPLAPWPGLSVALARPERRLSTAEVYRRCRVSAGEGPPVEGAAAAVAARSLKALSELMRNDLTEAAAALAPEVSKALQAAARAGVPALMSGSGPTVFALSDDPERMEALLAAWRADNLEVTLTELAARGVTDA